MVFIHSWFLLNEKSLVIKMLVKFYVQRSADQLKASYWENQNSTLKIDSMLIDKNRIQKYSELSLSFHKWRDKNKNDLINSNRISKRSPTKSRLKCWANPRTLWRSLEGFTVPEALHGLLFNSQYWVLQGLLCSTMSQPASIP